MSEEKIIKILREYNLWRRAMPPYDKEGERLKYTPEKIGLALDKAIEILTKNKHFQEKNS